MTVNNDLGIITGNLYSCTQWRSQDMMWGHSSFQKIMHVQNTYYYITYILHDGVILVIGFVGLLQLAITNKHFALTVLHSSQITINLLSVTALTSHCLVVASNSEHFPSSGFPKCSRSQLPAYNGNSSQQLNLVVL
jgi:hypothetical protein